MSMSMSSRCRRSLCFIFRRFICSTTMAQKNLSSVTGEFHHKPSSFRDAVSQDGSTGFKAEKGRYHLYVSYACPWAQRTLVGRALKGLEDVTSVDVVDHLTSLEKGWRFSLQKIDCTPDTVNGSEYFREVYFKAHPDYDGRFTVPVLWDKHQQTTVNNESAEILRMLNAEFNDFCATPEQAALDLYPVALREAIDELNEWICQDINNGVYRTGFAAKQKACDQAVREVFAALDRVEDILSRHRYLTGSAITEADVRLYTTLAWFDPVYVGLFKCNKKHIVDYPIYGATCVTCFRPQVSEAPPIIFILSTTKSNLIASVSSNS